MISLQTNVASLVAQNDLTTNSNAANTAIEQMSSGYRINDSGDDAAGLEVANQYRDQTAELNQGVRNASDGLSQLQIVDGGMSNISQILDTMQTLATQSASDTFTGNRSTLQTEFSSLASEIDRQATNIGMNAAYTNTAGDSVAAGSMAKNLSVYIGGGSGSTVTLNLGSAQVDSASLGLAAQNGGADDISTTAGAIQAVADLTTAVGKLGTAQGAVGTGENTLNYATNLANSQITNFQAAESQIRDANVAQGAAMTQANVLEQANMAAMAQANSAPQQVLKLLQG